jgi:hypothetical protein
MLELPVTLTTALILAAIAIGIATLTVLNRYNIFVGQAPTEGVFSYNLSARSFVEFLPAILLLMRLLETAGASRILLAASSVALVFARVLHGIGVVQLAPRFCHAAGAIVATMLIVLCTCYGLTLES